MQEKFRPVVLANEHVSFVILSDVWLDHPQTFGALEKLFQGYAEAAEYRPMVFVFCGNFSEQGWEVAGGIPRYTGLSLLQVSSKRLMPYSWFQRSLRPDHSLPNTFAIVTFHLRSRSI